MSLLAPLYVAGALAIALPILFHLIRRQPQGKQRFSSLMFLTSSPPRLTRRSRLTNLLLLLLRATALILLAIAFARPFIHQNAAASVDKSRGGRIAILVDTSASMRRGNLWQQAMDQTDRVLAALNPADEVGLFVFDRAARPAMTFEEWNGLEPSRRGPTLRARLAATQPSWDSTRIGEALATVADQLSAAADGQKTSPQKTDRQLVLISDMQRGGHVDALQGHEWPKDVLLDVHPVTLKESTNASIQVVHDPADAGTDPRVRLRISNEPGGNRDQFTVQWATEHGPIATTQPLASYVPPGRSQVIRMPLPPADQHADRIVMQGDDFDFDDTLFVVPPTQETLRVVYFGEDAPTNIKGLRYYLRNALADTPLRKVEIDTNESALADARLTVIATPLTEPQIASVRRFIEAGGEAMWILKDAAPAESMARLIRIDSVKIAEAPARDFSLLARVDFEHPLFAPFADARFADFTKIHFWKHRRIELSDPAAARAIAWFDNGDAFLLEHVIGHGRLLIATSGWHPADSQLALSTKFVPLLEGLVRRHDSGIAQIEHHVHDSIAATPPLDPDHPGIYTVQSNGRQESVAVNLSPDESRTAPVPVEELEQFGVRLGNKPTPAESADRQRQLLNIELENRQKLWRWLIAAVLILLAAETTLAGRLARRATLQPQVSA